MKYDTFLASSFELSLNGSQIAALFSQMIKNESMLEDEQLKILNIFRMVLYEHLSIEEVEKIIRGQD